MYRLKENYKTATTAYLRNGQAIYLQNATQEQLKQLFDIKYQGVEFVEVEETETKAKK